MCIGLVMGISSCDMFDDDHNDHVHAPDTYSFERDGVSTVSFPGQTARLNMAEEIYNALKNPSKTEAEILTMFDSGTGFSDASLDAFGLDGKTVGGKTAASSSASSTVKPQFDAMISHVVNNVFPYWNDAASAGVPGLLTEDDGDKRYVDSKGLEVDQGFIKGLIGALCLDQITNNYLTPIKLDGASNDPTSVGVGEYTTMEHYWDEGFGYLYGRETDVTDPQLGVGVLLNKYLKKVNESNDIGIADIIYDAFKLGRAAIVAQDYDERDEQYAIIKENLDKVIVYKASDYLRSGSSYITAGQWPEAMHALSEGYGFILSLQFTNYFSNSDVNTMLDDLMLGNGFWDRTPAELDAMADVIDAVL